MNIPTTIDQWHDHATEIVSTMIFRAVELGRDQDGAFRGNMQALMNEAFVENPGHFSSREELSRVHSEACDAKEAQIRASLKARRSE